MQINKIKKNPFIGPRPFGRNYEDQLLFFGRNYETEEIVTLILSHQLVLIYAQSGTGKTSILNANVIPELEEKEGFEILPTARVGISPYDVDETNSIKDSKKDQVVSNHYMFNALWSMKPNINPRSLTNMSLSDFLNKYFSTTEDYANFPFTKLIIFDQLEEIFNIFPKNWYEEQIMFFKQITDALNKNPYLRIVFVIREDYLAQLDSFSRILPEKLRPRFRLERLRKKAALQAIKGPLEKAKSYSDDKSIHIDKLFEEDIIDQLIDELLKIRIERFGGKSEEVKGEFIEPIQLQVVCQRMWNKLMSLELNQINKHYFSGLGDVDKALSDFYEDAIHEASNESKVFEGIIRNWFEEKLITSSDTRSSVHREFKSTGGISNTVVDILEKRYIIRKEERAGAKWYELTHDRFIKPIKDSNSVWKHSPENIMKMKLYFIKKKVYANKRVVIVSITFVFLIVLFIPFLYNNNYQHELEQQRIEIKRQQEIVDSNKLLFEQLTHGIKFFGQSDYNKAMLEFNKILSVNPNFTDALFYKGLILDKLGKFDESKYYYNKLYAIDPDYVDRRNTSSTQIVVGNNDDAKSYFEKALQINPNLKDTLEEKELTAFNELMNNTTKQ